MVGQPVREPQQRYLLATPYTAFLAPEASIETSTFLGLYSRESPASPEATGSSSWFECEELHLSPYMVPYTSYIYICI